MDNTKRMKDSKRTAISSGYTEGYDVLVVGAGASGLMAAATAASYGIRCLLLEGTAQPGSKILLTGKGRCNLTNQCDAETVISNTFRNGRFLYPALHRFPPSEITQHFMRLGIPLKTERGNRVFPLSDRAADIRDGLLRDATAKGVTLVCGRKVERILIENGFLRGVLAGGEKYMAPRVILACGGISYPETGSDGSGYRLAESIGHRIVSPKGTLTGLKSPDAWIRDLTGLTLKNIGFRLLQHGRTLYNSRGELLFTHVGISGPVVLAGSRYLVDAGYEGVTACIDLKPAMDSMMLNARILRDFSESNNRQFKNALDGLLPKRLVPAVVALSGIPSELPVHQITREQRARFCSLLKVVPMRIAGPEPDQVAIITAGGVDIRDIQPNTMESKILSGLYFCGEILDIDASTGGFNLTIAFATGVLAGEHAAMKKL